MFALTRHRGHFPAGRGAALLVGATAMAVLAGCGSSGSTTPSAGSTSSTGKAAASASPGTTVVAGSSCKSSSATKITFWAWVPGFGRAVDEFNKTHPGICVTQEDVGAGSPEYTKISDALKAGSGAPDVAEMEFDELPSFIIQKYLVNLVPYGADKYQSDFASWAWSQVTQNGAVYAMPSDFGPEAFYYDQQTLAKYKITPPSTWAELAADASALKAKGVKIPYALPLGREEAQAETMIWMLSGGDGYTDDVGSYTLDSQQNIETFDWLRDDLVDKGLTGPTAPAKLNRGDAFAAFAKGDVGMLNGHPTLMQMAAAKGVDYGTVQLPGQNGPAKSTMGVADWMMAFKQNGHAKQTGDFLNYVYSERNVLDFSREYDLLPVTSSASNTMASAGEDKKLWPFLKSLGDSELYPVGNTSWASVSEGIKQEIGSAVSPHGSPAAVLGRLQSEAAAAESAE